MKASAKPYHRGVIIGGCLAASPLLGLFVTAYGVFRSFGALHETGISDPQALSHNVALSLYANAVGLMLCSVGVVVLIVSLVLRSRARQTIPAPQPSLL